MENLSNVFKYFLFFRIELTSNYINLSIEPGKELNMYEVKFVPDIDSRPLRNRLLNQHTNVIGTTKNFDGALLYLPRRLSKDVRLEIIREIKSKKLNNFKILNF